MEHHTLDNWKNGFGHDGLLYFAQRLEEMLNPYTDHIFKAPVLNTRLLVDEYLDCAKNDNAKDRDAKYLDSIKEEFLSSLENDIVIKRHIDELKIQQITNKIHRESFNDQRKTMEYIKFLLSDYNQWCKKYLLEIVPQEKQKRKIEQAVRCYIPELVSSGYSSDFIYHFSIETFFKKNVNSLGSLHTFLNRFDFEKRYYDIYIAIAVEALRFREILEKRLSVSFGPFDDEEELLYEKDKYVLTKTKISALDEFSAVKKAYNSLNMFFTFYHYFSEKPLSWCFNDAKAVDHDKNAYIIPLKHQPCRIESHDIEFIARASDSIIMSLLHNSFSTYQKIDIVINLHNTGISDADIKNRFLDFWSILEILFVSDNNINKLNPILDNMCPILLKKYLWTLFSSIDFAIRNLENELDFKPIENQFAPEDRGGWPFFIFLNEYSKPLDMLYDLLADYPLLRTKIALVEDLCKNKRKFITILNKYSDRVTWHITRLYRTRNNIIHAGVSSESLQELVEHLHCYVDECLEDIVYLLANRQQMKSISNALIEIQLQKEEIYTILNDNSHLSRSDIETILKYT